jgi:thymidylate synthase (FAD)
MGLRVVNGRHVRRPPICHLSQRDAKGKIMRARLLAYTQQNPALTPTVAAGRGDLAVLWNGHGMFPEQLIEYAGRVCYLSTHRMGTAPEFISARVREGHEDIIEHVVITFRLDETDAPLRWRILNRHCEVTDLGNGSWLVSGNTRVWLALLRESAVKAEFGADLLPTLYSIAPKVYAEFAAELASKRGSNGQNATLPPIPSAQPADLDALLPTQDGPMRVTLLGYNLPELDNPDQLTDHGSATFLFEGISRTCTHQLVRHRLASFSQESQRYVDLSRGGWQAIVPDAIASNPVALAELEEFWHIAEEKYAKLRALGIRKEDARFLLPNAAETRIVATMNFAGWSHFFWLRAVDMAAQWEIRLMGQRALAMLYPLAPTTFQPHWDVYLERFT